MNKITIETPCILNGVILTEEVLNHISMLQTGFNWIDTAPRRFNNEGLTNITTDIQELTNHLISNMMDADTNDKPRIVELIESVYLLRITFERLKLPDELLTKQ